MSFFKGKLVTVTGGSGFIGRHFVSALLKAGARVRVPLHLRPLSAFQNEVETLAADLSMQEDCKRCLAGSEIVIHAAGAVSAAGVTTGANPMSAITTNLNLTAQVLEAAWSVGCERVLIFGSSTGYPVTEHPVTEEEMWSGPPHPSYFGYGWMRRYLERMSEFVTQRSPKTKVALVRPTATYGPGDDFDPVTSHIIPALIRRAHAKENPYEVWGTGDEVRDFLYVDDLIRGCLLAVEKHAVCDPINIGYGQQTTVRQVVEKILSLTGHTSAELVFRTDRPTTVPKRMVDCRKAKELLGFSPAVTLEEGLRRTIDYFRSNPVA